MSTVYLMTAAYPALMAIGAIAGVLSVRADHGGAALAVCAVAGWMITQHLALLASFAGPRPRPGRAGMIGVPGGHARILARRAARPSALLSVLGTSALISVTVYGFLAGMPVIPWPLLAAGIGALAATAIPGPGAVAVRKALVGAQAEERTAATATSIPGVHVVLNSLLLGAGGDIDHVIVSHAGLTAIETKYGRGPLSWSLGTLRAGRRTIPGDPISQVRRQAAAVARLTQRRVTAVVCVPEGTGVLRVDDVIVCGLRDLPQHLGVGPVLDDQAARAIVEVLGRTHRTHAAKRAAA